LKKVQKLHVSDILIGTLNLVEYCKDLDKASEEKIDTFIERFMGIPVPAIKENLEALRTDLKIEKVVINAEHVFDVANLNKW
jgi:hypothetical protein